MSSNLYNYVTTPYIGRSVFNLSYEKKFTADMGKLYPVCCEEVVPGDTFKLGNRCVLRFMPTIAPVMHEINVYTHYFFVPYRLLWSRDTNKVMTWEEHDDINNTRNCYARKSFESGDLTGDWESFISGGVDGTDNSLLPRFAPGGTRHTTVGTLWDFFGFPTTVNLSDGGYVSQRVEDANLPLVFPWAAYNYIYNCYYRDENLEPLKWLNQGYVLTRAWEKDYFTSALPWQQRGTSPALPVHTSINLPLLAGYDDASLMLNPLVGSFRHINAGDSFMDGLYIHQAGIDFTGSATLGVNGDALSSTFDISDLRLAFQLQKWLERNARGGVRYIEFLRSHFAISPRDERLQRPEYIGGTRQPVIISEVLQTSQTSNTPQGTMAGHGISVGQSYAGTYHVQEYGLIMGIMSVMPRTQYQQGINRAWLRKSRYDFFFPEFQNLSEQAIEQGELYYTGDASKDQTIFGYQGRYNEMRTRTNMTCGGMRDMFDYWHLGRKFDTSPNLNADFIKCTPSKRIFAVQDEDTMIVNFGNIIRATRPMVYSPEPGLIDHH